MPRLRSKRGASTTTPSGPTARSAGVRRTSLPRSLGVLAGPGPLAPTRVLNPRTSHYPCSGIWGQVTFTFDDYTGQNDHLRGNLLASLSCSTSNFVGLGCEHRGEFDSVQGLVGVILLGIMVAGFANRTRY